MITLAEFVQTVGNVKHAGFLTRARDTMMTSMRIEIREAALI